LGGRKWGFGLFGGAKEDDEKEEKHHSEEEKTKNLSFFTARKEE